MKKANTFLTSIYFLVFFSIILIQSGFAQVINLGQIGPKRTLALVIGISDYQYLDDLDYAHKDAEDFANFLTSEEGLKLPTENVAVFTNKQATKNELIYQGLDWLENELNDGDEAYIYFSGHGDITNKDVENLIKTGYLLTYESRKPHLEISALRMDYFLERFHTIASKKNSVIRLILDVCHAGFGLEKGVITLLEIDKNINEEKQIIITSCNDNEYSWEYPALKNSCFSYFFIEGLKGAADDNNDRNITLEELQDYSTQNVKRYVKKRSNEKERQTPQFKGSYYHVMARTGGQYTPKPIDYDNLADGSGKGQGTRKGSNSNAKKNEIKVENILDKTEDRSLSGKKIQNDFKLYQELPENTPAQQEAKRKKKRELVTAIVDNADKTLIDYYDYEDEMMSQPFHAPASEYYLIAANLLGEDHLLYDDLLGKYFFIEALKLNASGNSDKSEVIDKLNNSLKFEPDASYTLNELGNVYFAKGELEEALKYYEKAHNISPDWAKPLENKIETNNRLQKRHSTQNLLSAKSPSDPFPTPYEIISSTNFDSKPINNENAASASASPVFDNSQNFVFNIQLAAASKVNRSEFKKVEDLGTIYPEFNPHKNLINTWLGPFESEKEAKLILKTAKERGFKDAFIVPTARDSSFQKKLNEKRAELKKEKAAAMPYQVRIAAVNTYNKADFTELDKVGTVETESVTVKGKSFYRVLMRFNVKSEAIVTLQNVKKAGFKDAYIFENKAQYLKSKASADIPSNYEYTGANSARFKIQIASVSKLTENQFSNLEDLGQIYMDVIHEKGLIRVSLGDFQNKKEATGVLNKIKNLGYKDAFIYD